MLEVQFGLTLSDRIKNWWDDNTGNYNIRISDFWFTFFNTVMCRGQRSEKTGRKYPYPVNKMLSATNTHWLPVSKKTKLNSKK